MNKENFYKRLGKPFIVFITCVLVISGFCGCEPLRKKFTRKKNKDRVSAEFIPVLDPIDYPDRTETPVQVYAQHCSLWKMWAKDLLIEIVQERPGDKKIIYDLKQMLVHMDQMQKVLMKDKKKSLQMHMESLQNMLSDMDKPARLRNNYGIRSKVLRMEKDIRNNYKPAQLEEYFVSFLSDL